MSIFCECGCGTQTAIAKRDNRAYGWIKGQSKRFVHGHNKTKHGLSSSTYVSPEYTAYYNAKSRCNSPDHISYKNYGGRGVKFLFTSIEQFYAELGPKPSPKHSLDRINNDGNYEPGNVRWATKVEQDRKKRTTKLDADKVAKIRRMFASGVKARYLALAFNIAECHVYHIVSYRKWAIAG